MSKSTVNLKGLQAIANAFGDDLFTNIILRDLNGHTIALKSIVKRDYEKRQTFHRDEIYGDTYEVNDLLREHGFTWDREKHAWIRESEALMENVVQEFHLNILWVHRNMTIYWELMQKWAHNSLQGDTHERFMRGSRNLHNMLVRDAVFSGDISQVDPEYGNLYDEMFWAQPDDSLLKRCVEVGNEHEDKFALGEFYNQNNQSYDY